MEWFPQTKEKSCASNDQVADVLLHMHTLLNKVVDAGLEVCVVKAAF